MRKIQRKKKLFGFIVLFFAMIFCMNTGVLALAEEQENRKVRLAYGYNDFLKVDERGTVSGYYGEYLKKLAEINHWEYEYVYASWIEAVELLEKGDIDFLFPINYSALQDQTMDFSNMPIGYTASGIFALKDSDYDYDDFEAFDGARIAFARGSSNGANLAAFAKEHEFSYQPVYLETNGEIMEALRDGRADLAVSSVANEFEDGAQVAVMDAEPVYFTVREGNTEMLSQLNQGMQILLETNPDLAADVFGKTMIGDHSGMAAMTREERAFVESGRQVTVGFYEQTEPLAYRKEDGTYGGVYIELLNYIKEKSGLNLVFYPISRDKNWKELIKSGEIDFYVGSSGVIVAQNEEIRTTDSFMEFANILVTRNDCVFNKLDTAVVALTSGRSYWADYLNEYLDKKVEFKYYRTAKDCMNAVIQGKADATLLNNIEFNYHSKNDRLSTLIQWHQYRFVTKVGLAASAQSDEIMFSTVSKAVGMLPTNYVETVVDESLSIPYDSYSLADILYNARFPLVVVSVIVLASIGIAVLIWRFRRRQKQMDMEVEEKEREQLQLLAATSYEYSSVYYIDLDENMSEAVSQRAGLKEKLGVHSEQMHNYEEALRSFTEKYVLPEYRENILACMNREAVLARFQTSPQFSIRYQIYPDVREETYFEMIFIQVDKNMQGHNMMVMGIRCIDDIVREEQMQKQLLQDALDGANRANAAKSEFFSRMSHDIRTPLNAIIGLTAIASLHADNPERVRDALTKITGAGKHLLSLINDVLDMSKIETGKLSLTEENINLSDLIGNLLNIIRPQIKEHKHKLQVHFWNVQHEAVIGDSLRIQQVFLNLVGNAIKYTPDGGEISLTLREIPIHTPNAGCYEFVIADNGIGMSEEYIKHIYEPFSRAEDLRISKIQGTGLGMSITQNIVQMMNGTIKVESECGKGSTFTVTIFLKLQEGEEIDISELAGLSVLVADDDSESCESFCEILEGIGMKCEGYSDGQQAVEAVERSMADEKPYYAAILNWKMPGMDGIAAAKVIKELTDGALPVILCSSNEWADIEDEAKAAGVVGFLSKPVFRSGVIQALKELGENDIEEKSGENALEKIREQDYGNRRILLVEDNALNREIAREILEMANLVVEEAEDGQMALDMFAASEIGYYDLVLMDVQMPVLDGYSAAKALRAMDRPDVAKLPVIAMTANAFVEDIQKCKAAGMNDHLAKPIDFTKLEEILRHYLG